MYDIPLDPKALDLLTEPFVQTETSVYFQNLSKTETLVIADIYLTPGTAPIRWTGPGPFELAPDATSEIYVRFSPEDFGTWDEVLTFETNAGQFTVPITMRAEDLDSMKMVTGGRLQWETVTTQIPPFIRGLLRRVMRWLMICDGDIDEEFDQDGDGYFDAAQCPQGRDCDDTDKTANPGADEECDQTDSDCNGIVDDLDDLADLQEGVCEGMTKVCPKFGAAREPEYTDLPLYEVVEYTCDGFDNDCNGDTDAFDHLKDGTSDCVDDDGDGHSEVEGDCDDTDPEITRASCGTRQQDYVIEHRI